MTLVPKLPPYHQFHQAESTYTKTNKNKLMEKNLNRSFLKSENVDNMQIKNEIKDKLDFKKGMLKLLNEYDYIYKKKPLEEYDMDKIISKKIMFHLNDFFTKELSERMEHVVVVNHCNSNNKLSRCKKFKNMNKTKKKIK